MKIAILETGHFQYALTQSDIFAECEQLIITTKSIKEDILVYHPQMEKIPFELIETIEKDEKKIKTLIKDHQIDLLLISPVFDSYGALNRIVKNVPAKTVLTTHNINTWFNGRFWSPNSLRDRLNMRSIIRHSDYIAVEDFIYNHLKNTNHKYFQKKQFIYIPFTIFTAGKEKKFAKEDTRIKIVLTGAIDGDRRRYEDIVELIRLNVGNEDQITFSFAGRAKGSYGEKIVEQLRDIQKVAPSLVSFFDNSSTADMFRRELETADLVLSCSNKTFNGMGTVEYIGKTKPTAAIHDMMTYQLPGLLPAHLKVPVNLEGSVFNYTDKIDLQNYISQILVDRNVLEAWKKRAEENSYNFTAEKIRSTLPI